MLMSWQDTANKLTADWQAASQRITAHLDDLANQVAALKQQLASADIPADAQATLDALDRSITSFDVPAPPPPG
jgi:hypothetical protein